MTYDYDALFEKLEQAKIDREETVREAKAAGRQDIADILSDDGGVSFDDTINKCKAVLKTNQ